MANSSRLEVVDALRGVALLGIVLAHCPTMFFLTNLSGEGPWNQALSAVLKLSVYDKFFTIFSFLFGLGFSLRLLRTADRPARFAARFAWRLLILLGIGLLHHLHWFDDILALYAVLGLVLLAVRNVPERPLLIAAVFLVLNGPGQLVRAYDTVFPPAPEAVAARTADQQASMKTYLAMQAAARTGTYPEVVRANAAMLDEKLEYYLRSGRISVLLGFFLLGMIAGRRRVFELAPPARRLLRRLALIAGGGGVALTGLYLYSILGHADGWSAFGRSVVMNGQMITMTLTYVAAITLLLRHPALARPARALASLGRMALTAYVLHSVLGTLLLCGYGLGWMGYFREEWHGLLLFPPLAAALLAFSHLWFKRFAQGPLEWCWRSLTLLRRQPFRAGPVPAP